VNPFVYAEVAARFDRIEDLEDALPVDYCVRQALPWEAACGQPSAFGQACANAGGRRAAYFGTSLISATVFSSESLKKPSHNS
jgi:hypothetical protein